MFNQYIKGLVSVASLEEGSFLLDVGCGQGFFSYLFHKMHMKVTGIDLSETGIREARNTYGSRGINFLVGDALNTPFSIKFDCVFVRSFALYDTEDFPIKCDVTEALLSNVRRGGTFIFAYNTKLSPKKKSASWRNHTLSDVRRHFSRYPNTRIFFISKVDALLMRKGSFNPFVTKLNMVLSENLGLGGDVVCIFRKN
jgi:SAM-dependent methyltransferase